MNKFICGVFALFICNSSVVFYCEDSNRNIDEVSKNNSEVLNKSNNSEKTIKTYTQDPMVLSQKGLNALIEKAEHGDVNHSVG
ncbi:hypothetical protein [Undibacterium sp. TJN19]|uniref:hypothetical protein n=1 Tax=Undibacterium sp. TJN19 TaxID=3413055 RepID=UPI003BF5E807